MRGSMIASIIEAEKRREKYYKCKLKRQQCSINKEKQCENCKFFNICEDKEVKDVRNIF